MGIVDKLGWAIAEATVSRQAQREADVFARSVRKGHSYWTIHTHHQPEGTIRLLREWVFTDRAPITGNPMTADGMTAGHLWLNHGPVHAQRPAGIATLAEYEADPTDEWTPALKQQGKRPAGRTA